MDVCEYLYSKVHLNIYFLNSMACILYYTHLFRPCNIYLLLN